jgi:hypothetical protein
MTDITIPDEVAIAARDAWTHGPKDPIEAFRAALRAGLAAWPGMECKNTCGSYPPFPHIILPFPLPKEISDA